MGTLLQRVACWAGLIAIGVRLLAAGRSTPVRRRPDTGHRLPALSSTSTREGALYTHYWRYTPGHDRYSVLRPLVVADTRRIIDRVHRAGVVIAGLSGRGRWEERNDARHRRAQRRSFNARKTGPRPGRVDRLRAQAAALRLVQHATGADGRRNTIMGRILDEIGHGSRTVAGVPTGRSRYQKVRKAVTCASVARRPAVGTRQIAPSPHFHQAVRLPSVGELIQSGVAADNKVLTARAPGAGCDALLNAHHRVV